MSEPQTRAGEYVYQGHKINVRVTLQDEGKWAANDVYITDLRSGAGVTVRKQIVTGRWDIPDDALQAAQTAARQWIDEQN